MENNNIDIFDKNYFNKANIEETKEFKNKIKNDKKFRNEFKEYLILVEGIKHTERKELKKYLTRNRKVEFLQLFMKIAAVIAISFLVATSVYVPYKKLYFEKNLVIYDAKGNFSNKVLGDENVTLNASDYYSQAIILENAKEYEDALKIFNNIDKNETHFYFLAQYRTALIYIKMNKIDKAEKKLNFIININEEHFIQDDCKDLLWDLKIKYFFAE